MSSRGHYSGFLQHFVHPSCDWIQVPKALIHSCFWWSLLSEAVSSVVRCFNQWAPPLCDGISHSNTVGTPYNTAPYITGSNIARLGHGSQNSSSKLWVPVVKSAPVCYFHVKKCPQKDNPRLFGNTMEAEARLPVVLPFRYHCHLPLILPWSSNHDQGVIDANCICLHFTDTWAHRHRHPMDSCLQAR